MKARLIALAVAASLPAGAALAAAGSPVVIDAPTCAQALKDAQQAAKDVAVGPKARKAGEELLALAESRCAEENFAAAEQLLAIVRGIYASE